MTVPSAYHVGFPVLLLVVSPAVAIAQMPADMGAMPAQGCAAPVAPTGELAAWSQPFALSAAADARHAPTSRIEVGRAAQVKLLSTPEVHYSLQPEKPGGSVSYGGLLALRIARAGSYRVALGSPAWLDLVNHGKAVTSAAHGRGPPCSGIHKMVDFPLQAGSYTLQISANGEPQTTVLVVRLP